MSESNETTAHTSRAPRLRWVAISEMKVSPRAQRQFKPAQADEYAADFDLEALGYPVVNLRDGYFWIVDGQHRIAALKLIGWGDQQVQCEAYEGLSEAEEAELFLRRDNRRAIATFPKFAIGVVAGRKEECDIDRIVQEQNLTISRSRTGIGAVGSLRRVYRRGGPEVLARTLQIIRDAYGDAGFKAAIIDGVGLVCQRYNGQLNAQKAVERLSCARGGMNGLLNQSQVLKKQTGNSHPQCVAAAAVEIINTGRGGTKLTPWWRADDERPHATGLPLGAAEFVAQQ